MIARIGPAYQGLEAPGYLPSPLSGRKTTAQQQNAPARRTVVGLLIEDAAPGIPVLIVTRGGPQEVACLTPIDVGMLAGHPSSICLWAPPPVDWLPEWCAMPKLTKATHSIRERGYAFENSPTGDFFMPGVLTGLIPACHTPFDRAGNLNLSIVEQQAALFRESGLRSVFVGGTTGEFASLTMSERKALCERWVAVAGDSLQVAVHAGSNCQADAIELAAHAQKAGATAVAAVAPELFQADDRRRPD